ncbi:hypothetical protein IDM36_13140 [Enterobacter mori]|uniref:Uncharacterized protein n=1 Tax=Enterobacter mori TaxID=539813 RepID=A0A7T0GZB0_9ENTR|nr:hypothetical protein [Enterobacter mori]QPJ98885.1 hypothetical protein IDM36_13140 [Enterobacter mori]
MSGFEVYNSNNKLLIDSNNRSTLFYDIRNIGAATDVGSYSVDSPFGTGSTLGSTMPAFWSDGTLRWLQLSPGKYGFPGADMLESSAGRMIRTSRKIGMESGYLDVFNGSGNLIWSAVSASKMPRVVGFFDVPPGYDLQNNTFAVSVAFNPWILVNNCPGNLSDDGEVVGYSGVMLKWTGSQLLGRYISKNQKNWSQTLQSKGIRIPLAQFVGI